MREEFLGWFGVDIEDDKLTKKKWGMFGNSKIFFMFIFLFGEMIQFHEHIFSDGLIPPIC